MPYYPTRKLTILALDPSVKDQHGILKTQIEIPNEALDAGPRGYRVQIIDYDSTSDSLYNAAPIAPGVNCESDEPTDPFADTSDSSLLADPAFHAFMTYGIVMKTLSSFEYALGRRLGWSFEGHQIQVAPHAFADANAFYSDRAHGLYFGYFPSTDGKRRIFTCLSREIVAHETTHALLDGLRERYTDPSSPQQAGFHEGFADIIALLSILSAESVVAKVVDMGVPGAAASSIRRADLSPESLKNSGLLGLAQEMGSELAGVHGQALRRSVTLKPKKDYLTSGECDEPHACGEVLVAAVLNAYVAVWVSRLRAIGDESKLDRTRAAEEGAELADRLLTICIRAIDYCPPTDLQFHDFACALLTVDSELNPRDDKYNLRDQLLHTFRAYGILDDQSTGLWDPPDAVFNYDRTHFDSMKVDPDELFRFIWENAAAFELNPNAYTRVLSVRPCVRTGRDGFILRETVAEYHQQLTVFARELGALGVTKPPDMPPETEVTLYGGNAVIFDEYGHVKYNIGTSIIDPKNPETQERQSKRLEYLWRQGAFGKGASKMRAFARMHVRRATDWYRSVMLRDADQVE
jgi:hypothetical protein